MTPKKKITDLKQLSLSELNYLWFQTYLKRLRFEQGKGKKDYRRRAIEKQIMAEEQERICKGKI